MCQFRFFLSTLREHRCARCSPKSGAPDIMFDLLVHAVAGGAHAHLLVAEHGANAADPTSRALGEKAGLHKLDLVGSNNEVYDR